ncbi:MAG: flagellin [Clostridia bacterium]|jgi:flagellin|nr:flagellin [Clostridia bacterium]
MRINHNLQALNSYNRLAKNQAKGSKSIGKLSSGLRINSAADDAAGLTISEKMRSQIKGLEQASRNAQDGISLIQTAEGALGESHAILQKMRELAVQSANDTNVDVDRVGLQSEVDQLAEELTRIADNTEFNTKKVLNGSFSGSLHIGANKDQNVSFAIADMKGTALGVQNNDASTNSAAGATQVDTNNRLPAGVYTLETLDTAVDGITDSDTPANAHNGINRVIRDASDNIVAVSNNGTEFFKLGGAATKELTGTEKLATVNDGDDPGYRFASAVGRGKVVISDDQLTATVTSGVDITDATTANDAIETITEAVNSVSAERAKMGATQNRLEHTINNLGASAENMTAAESRIRDVDMAKEMMSFTKNNILTQAAQSMLAQANQAPQGVLQLLRG